MTPWVESDQLEAHLRRVGADEETRGFCRTLAETGLAVLDLGEAGRRLVDQAVADTEPCFQDPAVARVQDAWLRSAAVRRLASLPPLMDVLRTAYGRRPFAFQTLNFHRGTQQPLHSDAIHFHSEPARFMCGVWIALEDISAGSGPLTYACGSHRLPILTMRAAGVDRPRPDGADYDRCYLPALHRQLAAAALAERTCLPRKGQAVVWAANLAHGGSPILDPAATRRSLVAHVYFEDCLYYTPMMSDPERGLYKARLPLDVRTNGWVWPRRDGRRVAVSRDQFAEALLRRVLRRPTIQRYFPHP